MAIQLAVNFTLGQYFKMTHWTNRLGVTGLPNTLLSGDIGAVRYFEVGFRLNNTTTNDASSEEIVFWLGYTKNSQLKTTSSTITDADFNDLFNQNQTQRVQFTRPTVVGQSTTATIVPRWLSGATCTLTFVATTGGGNPTLTMRITIEGYQISPIILQDWYEPNVANFESFDNNKAIRGFISGSESFTHIFRIETITANARVSTSDSSYLTLTSYFQRLGLAGGKNEWNNGLLPLFKLVSKTISASKVNFIVSKNNQRNKNSITVIACKPNSVGLFDFSGENYFENTQQDILIYDCNTLTINNFETKNPLFSQIGLGFLPANLQLKVSQTSITTTASYLVTFEFDLPNKDKDGIMIAVIMSSAIDTEPSLANEVLGSENRLYIGELSNTTPDNQDIITKINYDASQNTNNFAIYNHTVSLGRLTTKGNLSDILPTFFKFGIKKGITNNDIISFSRLQFTVIEPISQALIYSRFLFSQGQGTQGYNVAPLSNQNLVKLQKTANNPAQNNKALLLENQFKLVRNDGGSFVTDGFTNGNITIAGDVIASNTIISFNAGFLILQNAISPIGLVGTYLNITITQGANVKIYENNYAVNDEYTFQFPIGIKQDLDLAGKDLEIKCEVFATQTLQNGDKTLFSKSFTQTIQVIGYTNNGTITEATLGNDLLFSAQENEIVALLNINNIQAQIANYFVRLGFIAKFLNNIFGLQRLDSNAIENVPNKWIQPLQVSFPNPNQIELRANLSANLSLNEEYLIDARVGSFTGLLPEGHTLETFKVVTSVIPSQVVGLIPFDLISQTEPTFIDKALDLLVFYDNANPNSNYSNDSFYFYFDFTSNSNNDFVLLQEQPGGTFVQVAILDSNVLLGTPYPFGFFAQNSIRKGYKLEWRKVFNAFGSGAYKVIVSDVLTSPTFHLEAFDLFRAYQTFKVRTSYNGDYFLNQKAYNHNGNDEIRLLGTFDANAQMFEFEQTSWIDYERVVLGTRNDLKVKYLMNISETRADVVQRLLSLATNNPLKLSGYKNSQMFESIEIDAIIDSQSVETIKNNQKSAVHNVNIALTQINISGNRH